jgi:glycosyltransferase involved in cell wall biosynthesis
MRILIVNDTVIPAKDYGGSERIIWWLGKELARRGHKVSYLVASGSFCPFAEKVLGYDHARPLALQIPSGIEVVHLNFQTSEILPRPCLMTHHGNFHKERNFNQNTVFVSRSHAHRHGSETYVHNAIDPEEYGPVDWGRERRHLLFLGYAKRPEKNLKTCQRLARQSGRELAVVGRKSKWYRWRPGTRYCGFLGGQAKNDVLNASQALLYPVRWHEPFGIALVEALYFGNPVFGTPYGSLPELITPEVGFLSNCCSQLLEAVKCLEKFDRKACHDYVMTHFHVRRMAQQYLQLYQKILDGEYLNRKPPENPGNFNPRQLLPLYN